MINTNSMNTAPNAPSTPDAQLVCANSTVSLVIVIGTVLVRAGSPVIDRNSYNYWVCVHAVVFFVIVDDKFRYFKFVNN